MKRWWPLAVCLPLVAGLAIYKLLTPVATPQKPKKPEMPSRTIEGVTVRRPEPRVVTIPETPKDVAQPVNQSRVRDLVNQAVAASVRNDPRTRSALVSALMKEPTAKSEIEQMRAGTGGAEAAHLAALAREVAP